MFGAEYQRFMRSGAGENVARMIIQLGAIIALFFYLPLERAAPFAILIVMLEMATQFVVTNVKADIGRLERKLWMDTLTNRLF